MISSEHTAIRMCGRADRPMALALLGDRGNAQLAIADTLSPTTVNGSERSGVAHVVWRYEPPVRVRPKHRWHHDYAGSVRQGKNVVAKCPSSISQEQAEELLNSGIPWWPKDDPQDGPPRKIYAIKDGVLYRAVPTIEGKSYHGFPELPSEFPRGNKALKQQILDRAREIGCEDKLKEWMKW